MKTTIDIHIFVFEDYGIATIQVGSNIEETMKAVEALTAKCKARYLLQVENQSNVSAATIISK